MSRTSYAIPKSGLDGPVLQEWACGAAAELSNRIFELSLELQREPLKVDLSELGRLVREWQLLADLRSRLPQPEREL